MKKALIILVLAFMTQLLCAQSFDQAKQNARSDLEQAQKELAQLYETITKERIPLAEKHDQLEKKAIALRKEAERANMQRDRFQFSLNELISNVKKQEETNSYLSSLLNDYIRRFETQIHFAEVQRYNDVVTKAKTASEDTELGALDKFKVQLTVLDTALDHVEQSIGGSSFSGKSVIEDGSLLEEGQYTVMGPIAYFASSVSDASGIATMDSQSANPVTKSPNATGAGNISDLVDTGMGTVPVDGTLYDAFKITSEKDTLKDQIEKGGMVMYPIIALFLIAIGISIFKFVEILMVKKARAQDLETILRHLKQNDPEAALKYAKSVGGPVGEMLSAAVEYSDEDKEVIEEVLYEKIIITQPKLERFLSFIAVTAATAPLLGLLGTVTGMIKTFKLITLFGTGDASSLSSGISEALLTTKFGLIVAIPTLILHALLSRQAKGVISSMEQTAVGFINGIVDIRDEQDQEAAS